MPKLPANLPENWTQGQTISPNGTEVGLTEQHGYNYLMKQVNNTQTEVNNINGALPDVAQQATVNEINNKIGTESDADTQPTLFGRLAQLKNVLVEKLAELMTKVTGMTDKIGETDDLDGTDSTGSVMAKLNALFNLITGKVIVHNKAGVYEFTVPAGIKKIKIDAAGAGGGSGGNGKYENGGPGSSLKMCMANGTGGGAGATYHKVVDVTPGQKITITVGKKGVGGKGKTGATDGGSAEKGTDGTATVIGNIVTLPGGKGGLGGPIRQNLSPSDLDAVGSESGGSGGSKGKGGNGKIYYSYSSSGHYGDVTNPNGTSWHGQGGTTDITGAKPGAFGSGGSSISSAYEMGENYIGFPAPDGNDGSDGYVRIEWGAAI